MDIGVEIPIKDLRTREELIMENSQLRDMNRKLRFSSRKQLLEKVLYENIELQEELESARCWIAYLEARFLAVKGHD